MNRWVPPSCVIGGIYAFNDQVAHPWFAPAGLNRGGIDIAIQAEQLNYIKRLMGELIAGHTGQDVEQVQADSDRDRWFTAEEAKEYGIVDHVIASRGEVN